MASDEYIDVALKPETCRTCLLTSGHLNLDTSYFVSGVKEVYSEMLQECFNISLTSLAKCTDQSRLICNSCVSRLREACAFRHQVIEADHRFQKMYTPRCFAVVNVDLFQNAEDSAINSFSDHDFDDLSCAKDCDNLENTDTLSWPERLNVTDKTENITVKRKRKRRNEKRVKTCNTSENIEEDNRQHPEDVTPDFESENLPDVAMILGENATNDPENCYQEITKKSEPTDKNCKADKQISERKRVMLTTQIVLKETTACPFRHQKSWFQCFFCLEEFMELNLLRTHISRTHPDVEKELKKLKRYPRSLQIDITDLRCLKCDLILTTVSAMKEHLLDIHNKVIYQECIADYIVDKSPYACHLCSKVFHVFRSLTTHLNDHYANCICDVCGKSFINSKRLKVHKRTHDSGDYPCPECGKVLKTKTSKANHMESAHSKRILKCHICNETMKHYNDRIKHMSDVHNITHSFKCSLCPKEYNIKHYLATHMRQTHGNKNKECSVCSMAFITNHGLKKHMMRHSGEKPFTCEFCSKSYVRSHTLKEHLRTHDAQYIIRA